MQTSDKTTTHDIERAFAIVLRDNLFGGKELALIEPFDGPRPLALFAGVQLLSADPVLHQIYDYYDKDGCYMENQLGETYCTLRVTFYGRGARQKAVDCQSLLHSKNRNFDIAPITGYGAIGAVRDATADFLGKREERAQMEVELTALLSCEHPIPNIQFVQGVIVHDRERTPFVFGGRQ